MMMNIVPKHKLDFEACNALTVASDEQVLEALPSLLKWLQDLNWPVSVKIVERVSLLEADIDSHLLPILKGPDAIWKSTIINGLLANCQKEISLNLAVELNRIIQYPTNQEKLDGADVAAKEFMSNRD